jgi:hypothetical protein
MRRGCVAIGEFICSECGKTIEQGQRYLILQEDEQDEKQRWCVECCLKSGYAVSAVEKGEEILTFFTSETDQKQSQ